MDDLGLGRRDLVFRQSATASIVAALGTLAAAALIGFAAHRGELPWVAAAPAGAGLLLFSAISAATARRAFAPANWLLATDGERLLIKFRSYLNTDLPTDGPQVIELRRGDVKEVRVTRLSQTVRSHAGDSRGETSAFLDLVLSPTTDPADLKALLNKERALRSPGATWRHYPVTLVDERTIRVEWRGRHARVRPGLDVALRALGWLADSGGAVEEHVDPGAVGRRPRNEDEDRAIRMLAEQGRILDATLLTERTFGMTTTEARGLVEQVVARGRERDAGHGREPGP